MTKERIYSIGVDIGGTKMSGVLFDGARVLADYTLATPKEDLDKFMVMLLALIEPLRERAKKDKVKIKGVGLGTPGIVDFKEEKIFGALNLPILNGVNLLEKLKSKVEADWLVKIDNDAKCFVRAEALSGAGKNYRNIFGVTVGTGIGGGWWFNNQSYNGSRGSTVEISQMVVDFTTGFKLEEAYHKLTQSNPALLADEAYHGDILAEKAYEEVGRILGVAFANVVNLIDPEIIVVGGGVVESSDLFLPQVKKVMKEYIASPTAKNIKVVKSKLGKLAGAIGAALLIS